MKMLQKLETKTLLMTKKIIQLMAKIKSQVNQKPLKMPPTPQIVLQEMHKTLLMMLKITPKN